MQITYITSVDPDETGAPSNHVKESVSAMRKAHEVFLVHAKSGLFRVGRKTGRKNNSILFPKIKGGWRYFEYSVARYIDAIEPNNMGVVYLRVSPSVRIARALRGISQFKVMEVNGLEVVNHAGFEDMLLCVDLILVGSEEAKSGLLSLFPELIGRVEAHSNVGVSTNFFKNIDRTVIRERLGISKSEVVMNVSGFQMHHDFNTLLLAFKVVKSYRDKAVLVFVGDGPLRKQVEELAEDLSLLDSVVFMGAVPVGDIPEMVVASDVCVNAMTAVKVLQAGNISAQKTYEYLACGRPVVESCDLSLDVPDWARENLIFAAPGDVDSLADGIVSALCKNIYWLERAGRARSYVAKAYSWDAVADNTIRLIQERMARRAGSA